MGRGKTRSFLRVLPKPIMTDTEEMLMGFAITREERVISLPILRFYDSGSPACDQPPNHRHDSERENEHHAERRGLARIAVTPLLPHDDGEHFTVPGGQHERDREIAHRLRRDPNPST